MTRTGTPSASDDLAARAIGLVEADPPRARRIAEVAVGAARSTGDPAATSRALRALGLATWELGDVAAAAGVLRQAVAAGCQDGPVGELRAAEARRTLCWVLSDLGDTRGALREAALAAAHFRGRELAILLTQRAWVLQRAGRYDEALADYRRARALLRRERSRPARGAPAGQPQPALRAAGPAGRGRGRPAPGRAPVRRAGPGGGGGQDPPQPRVRGRPPR